MKSRMILCVSVLFIIVFFSQQVRAIPAFARRYKFSCSTCHAPFPKLKPYGDDFAGAGFILKEEDKPRDYVSAGDDLLWLNRVFPVAVRLDAYAMYDQNAEVDKDLQTPWGLKLMSGGTVYKNIGYYFYFYMSERGEVAGIEDAYVHFDNVFGSNLDIMVGQFQTCDPLMKRELRLTFEDYVIYKQHFGNSATNLAYDRGITLVYGIEKTGTDIVGFIVNGNGKAEADENKKFDQDSYKNFGIRVAQSIGDFLTIGGFYCYGKEKKIWEESIGYSGYNSFSYVGPDINFNAGPFELTVQYLMRNDDNVLLYENGSESTVNGIVIEAIFAPHMDKSRYLITALYNQIDFDLKQLKMINDDRYDYETATLSATYLLARNLRLIAEYTRDLKMDSNRFTVGTVTAF